MTLKRDQIINLKSDVQYEFDNIIIPFAAHLRVKDWNPHSNRGGRLILNVFDMVSISRGGSIDLSKSGYYGGRKALCCGGSYGKNGPNIQCIKSEYGGGGGGMAAGGGSYGTKGDDGTLEKRKRTNNIHVNDHENIWNDKSTQENKAAQPDDDLMDIGYAGNCYGDARISKLFRGSGGGSSFWSGGGRGGGALLLITNNLVNNGEIKCYGGMATNSGSGGGSGGSILIDVLGEEECVIGNVNALGGVGKYLKGSTHGNSYGGSGGYGRICIVNKKLTNEQEQDRECMISHVAPRPHITWEIRTDGNKYKM